MRIRMLVVLFSASLALSAGLGDHAQAAQVNVIELDNQIISPVTQQYILDAIQRSEQEHAECLVVLLDTPGGLLESTRAIVKAVMNARVPVVVYVAPSGARAGSAGVFITLAAHIAAMAPSTNIGAAHPVMSGGGGPVKKLIRKITRAAKGEPGSSNKSEEEEVVEEEKSPMDEKILNDTVAWMSTIARTRHRNEAWAKQAVTESVSITEEEAVKDRIVDLSARDLHDLLAKIDGWPVDMPDGTRTLATANAQVVTMPLSTRQQFLATITNPNIAYLLMLLGTLGLVFEFTHPGIGFPGIAGLICIILALYAFQALPINYAALALMGVGLLLLIAEIKVVSHGLLALGGVIALTLGSLLLVESADPMLQISLRVILPTVGTLAAIVLFVLSRAIRAQGQRVTTGPQGLVGDVGTASTDLNPDGKVFVHGEVWNATSPAPIRQGERIRVVSVNGMHVTVEKVT